MNHYPTCSGYGQCDCAERQGEAAIRCGVSPVAFAIEYFNCVQRKPSLGEVAALELAVLLRDAAAAEKLKAAISLLLGIDERIGAFLSNE